MKALAEEILKFLKLCPPNPSFFQYSDSVRIDNGEAVHLGGESKITRKIESITEDHEPFLLPITSASSALANMTGEIQIKTEPGKVKLIGSGKRYTLQTALIDDYPEWHLGRGEAETKISLEAATLRSLIEGTTYAAAAKDHRRVLMGINIEVRDMQITATATDGKKLARKRVPLTEQEGPDCSVILPLDVAKSLSSLAGQVEIEITSGYTLTATTEDGSIEAKCIEGKYPDCDQVIPRDRPIKVEVNVSELTRLAKAGGATADERNNAVALSIHPDKIACHSWHHDRGEFIGEVPATSNVEATLEMAFNWQFLTQTIAQFSGDITIQIRNGKSPVIIESDDLASLVLIMPIKLADVPNPGEQTEQADG